MSQVVYVHEYQGLITGWKKKLEIIPASATELTEPVYIPIPPDCVIVKGLGDGGWEKYPWGLSSAASLEGRGN